MGSAASGRKGRAPFHQCGSINGALTKRFNVGTRANGLRNSSIDLCTPGSLIRKLPSRFAAGTTQLPESASTRVTARSFVEFAAHPGRIGMPVEPK
jgi:hypothetical protein